MLIATNIRNSIGLRYKNTMCICFDTLNWVLINAQSLIVKTNKKRTDENNSSVIRVNYSNDFIAKWLLKSRAVSFCACTCIHYTTNGCTEFWLLSNYTVQVQTERLFRSSSIRLF